MHTPPLARGISSRARSIERHPTFWHEICRELHSLQISNAPPCCPLLSFHARTPEPPSTAFYAHDVPLALRGAETSAPPPRHLECRTKERAEQTLPIDPKREALSLNCSEASTIERGWAFERGNRSLGCSGDTMTFDVSEVTISKERSAIHG